MSKLLASLAAAVLVGVISFPVPAEADGDGPTCDSTGDATCVPATCEDENAVYRATIDQLERQLQRAEQRIERKNATIKRLRKALRDDR